MINELLNFKSKNIYLHNLLIKYKSNIDIYKNTASHGKNTNKMISSIIFEIKKKDIINESFLNW